MSGEESVKRTVEELLEDDWGTLEMQVHLHEGRIVIAFGESVDWIGLPPAKAKELGQALIEASDELLAAMN